MGVVRAMINSKSEIVCLGGKRLLTRINADKERGISGYPRLSVSIAFHHAFPWIRIRYQR
jgi:hypothetical protein